MRQVLRVDVRLCRLPSCVSEKTGIRVPRRHREPRSPERQGPPRRRPDYYYFPDGDYFDYFHDVDYLDYFDSG